MELGGALYYHTDASHTAFRNGVAIIPDHILASYLDDLLDLGVPERRLCIGTRSTLGVSPLGVISAITGAVLSGLFTWFVSGGVLAGAAVTLGGFFIILGLLRSMPTGKLSRRMGLAHFVTRELVRRRGGDEGATPSLISAKVIPFPRAAMHGV